MRMKSFSKASVLNDEKCCEHLRGRPVVVFMGGILLSSQRAQIERDSTGVIQYAADVLQRAIVNGLTQAVPDIRLSIVNLPFVGSYPQNYRRLWFPRASEVLPQGTIVHGVGFLNLRFFGILSRFLSSLRGLKLAGAGGADIIIIYSADISLLAAAYIYTRFFSRLRLCLVLPDFLEFMGDQGGWKRFLLHGLGAMFRFFAGRIDYFVFITAAMAEKIGVSKDRYVVVEGMCEDGRLDECANWPEDQRRIFLYSGTLARRYGITDLLDAFSRIQDQTIALWICGEGDSRQDVIDAASRDPRIVYFGQVPRERVLELQEKAHILVNPRRPEGEYTKYSFPSKTIEYLAAGRPVIMHRLPGVPDEYLRYLFIPPTPDTEGLTAALQVVARARNDELRQIGRDARHFIKSAKTSGVQCARIAKLIFCSPS
jgi:glycosyltransferase involved in cell wall biosynthesis